MSTQLCRPCRELARRQLRALIGVNSSARAAAPTSEIATHSRRPFHQTSSRRANEAQSEPSIATKVLTGIAKVVLPQRATLPYAIYGATQGIYKSCSEPAAYKISEELRKEEQVPATEGGEELGIGGGVWHDGMLFGSRAEHKALLSTLFLSLAPLADNSPRISEFKLPPTFSTWSQVTMLHLYLVVVRLRCLEKDAWQAWQTQLVNHFFQHAEDLMEVNHGMSRMIRSRHLNALFQTWRGVILAYDEGLVKGDAVMAAAVWRNVFRSSEDVDMRHVAAIVMWMRMTLRSLDELLDPALLYHGAAVFKTQPSVQLLSGAELPSVEELVATTLGAQKPIEAVSTKATKAKGSRFN